MDLLEDLKWRGLSYQCTNPEELAKHLATGSRQVYGGFDPTADSLTIGNLVPLLLLRRFQLAGHRPVALVGGGTGMIGDPSGKEAERQLMTPETIARHIAGQRRIYERVLDFSGDNGARLVNNGDWLGKLGFLEALRDIGKHFSINMMIQKDSVRERLENREQGISYTEFSYMLLQAYDFSYLFSQQGVTVQIAGSDQWGNIVAGVDLVRRTQRAEVFGLTAPLVTKADGGKFGKTEKGAVWLTEDRTSPYAFYQFWLNSADADVPKFLKVYSLLDRKTLEELIAEHERDPGARVAHKALAAHVTELVHGKEGLAAAEAATHALFSGEVKNLPRQTLDELFASAPASTLSRERLGGDGIDIVDLLVDGAVVKSKREARQFLQDNAILVNGEMATLDQKVTVSRLLHDEIVLIRRGKRNWFVIKVA
jgi:tyrosyl-tRNA synthetase